MAEGHYPLDNQILKMYGEGKKIEAEFGLYIATKENLQRIGGELPRGQFYMSVGNVGKDLEISRAKAQRIIDEYREKGIIKLIYQYEKWEKKPSIWEVKCVSKSDTRSDIRNDTQNNMQKSSNTNNLEGASDIQKDIQSDIQSDTSKKENMKKKIIKIYIDLKFIDDVIDKVKITQEQYENLVNKFNKGMVHKNIMSLDNYIANGKGTKYKDHYKVLNTWCNKDGGNSNKKDNELSIEERRRERF